MRKDVNFLRIPGLELSEDESEDEIVDHELDVFKSLYDEQHVSIDKENQSLQLTGSRILFHQI